MSQITIDFNALVALPNLLDRLERAVAKLDEPDVVLNTAAAAALLNISHGEIRALAAAGQLPAYPLGNGWRYSRRELLAWFAQRARSNMMEQS